MSEKRFADDGADAFERQLLASAKRDGMSAERKRALAIALASGAAGTATIGATSISKAAATASITKTAASVGAGGAAANAKAALGTAALIKWLAIGAVGVAGGSAVAVVVHDAKHPTDATEVVAAAAAQPPTPAKPRGVEMAPRPTSLTPETPTSNPAPPTDVPEPNAATPAPTDVRPTPRVRPVPPAAAAVPRADASSSPPTPPTLAEELRLIERARAALAAGDATGASTLLDEHAHAFPTGAFGDEAQVLRVEALTRSGQHARGVELARAYLLVHPNGPHAPRMNALIGAKEAP